MQQMKDDAWPSLLGRVLKSVQGQEAMGQAALSPRAAHAPVVDFINKLIEEAVQKQASDIHLEPIGDMARVRLRIDGDLLVVHGPFPVKAHAFFIARLKIMAGLDTTEKRMPLDGRIHYDMGDGRPAVDIRLSTMPLMHGEKAVLRLLYTSRKLLGIGQLDFSAGNERAFRRLCHSPNGMLLVSGPVNSGKTTTLYAALHELNTESRNLVTIEDPPEYHLEGVNQMAVNAKTGLGFARGLRAVLRQDVDVVMVGEIRDEETAEIAVRASLAGRLLFSTIHTGSAVGAIYRLLDMGIAPYLLASALNGIVAQRLVRRICPHCRKERKAGEEWSSDAFFLGRIQPDMVLYRGEGCPACHGTGCLGRMAIQELFAMGEELRQAILERKPLPEAERIAENGGMLPLAQDGLHKALAGETTLEEVKRVLYGDI